jgi:transcriptional regulator with XRE-family HTH domain
MVLENTALGEKNSSEARILTPGDRAKILLIQRGLTPADLAELTGLSLRYLYQVLRGHVVSTKGRRRVEKVLGRIWSEEES